MSTQLTQPTQQTHLTQQQHPTTVYDTASLKAVLTKAADVLSVPPAFPDAPTPSQALRRTTSLHNLSLRSFQRLLESIHDTLSARIAALQNALKSAQELLKQAVERECVLIEELAQLSARRARLFELGVGELDRVVDGGDTGGGGESEARRVGEKSNEGCTSDAVCAGGPGVADASGARDAGGATEAGNVGSAGGNDGPAAGSEGVGRTEPSGPRPRNLSTALAMLKSLIPNLALPGRSTATPPAPSRTKLRTRAAFCKTAKQLHETDTRIHEKGAAVADARACIALTREEISSCMKEISTVVRQRGSWNVVGGLVDVIERIEFKFEVGEERVEEGNVEWEVGVEVLKGVCGRWRAVSRGLSGAEVGDAVLVEGVGEDVFCVTEACERLVGLVGVSG